MLVLVLCCCCDKTQNQKDVKCFQSMSCGVFTALRFLLVELSGTWNQYSTICGSHMDLGRSGCEGGQKSTTAIIANGTIVGSCG